MFGKNKKEKEIPEPIKQDKVKSLWRDMLDSLLTYGLILAFVFFILNYCGQRAWVDGKSMNDTLQHMDQLVNDKFTYNFIRDPERYDIIIFRVNHKVDTYFIKRIIGLPGETVQIRESRIYINGEVIDDPYKNTDEFLPGSASVPITLGENEYFVLGDNRNVSEDSRYIVGNVNSSQIIGRAWLRFWPLESFGVIAPK